MNAKRKKNRLPFIEPEKIKALRTQQEIELKQGREWTRELPPPPILPPYGKLEKISGQLESFKSERFREYFGVDSYRTSPLPEVSDDQCGVGAAIAIAAGSPALGTLIMTESESENDTAEYVQGKINSKPFCGWVGQTRLKVGNDVELVAEWQQDHYQVYAITLPKERIVSICPRCDRGHIAHAWWGIKNMFMLTTILMSFIAVVFIVIAISDGNLYGLFHHSNFIIGWMIMFSIFFLGSALIAWSVYKAYTPTACKLAEEIFSVLELQNVAKIDLGKITKKRKRQLKKEGRWQPIDEQGRPACPSLKYAYSRGKWYYY